MFLFKIIYNKKNKSSTGVIYSRKKGKCLTVKEVQRKKEIVNKDI